MLLRLIGLSLVIMSYGCSLPLLGHKPYPREMIDNRYWGTIPGFTVEISEVVYENGWVSRETRLEPIGARQSDCFWCNNIAGFDYEYRYEGAKDWDRISRCGWPDRSNGCNAVRITPNKRVWEPCNDDKDKLAPFSDETVAEITKLLNEAMVAVYNKSHLTDTTQDFMRRLGFSPF